MYDVSYFSLEGSMEKPEVRFLQHLGIVAGMCSEIGIAEQIDGKR